MTEKPVPGRNLAKWQLDLDVASHDFDQVSRVADLYSLLVTFWGRSGGHGSRGAIERPVRQNCCEWRGAPQPGHASSRQNSQRGSKTQIAVMIVRSKANPTATLRLR
jgi:hypothetical protein